MRGWVGDVRTSPGSSPSRTVASAAPSVCVSWPSCSAACRSSTSQWPSTCRATKPSTLGELGTAVVEDKDDFCCETLHPYLQAIFKGYHNLMSKASYWKIAATSTGIDVYWSSRICTWYMCCSNDVGVNFAFKVKKSENEWFSLENKNHCHDT